MTGDAVKIRLPFVYSDRDRHGNQRFYFWRGRGHRKVRIREAEGSPAFMARYQELLASEASTPGATDNKPPVGTWRWLAEEYMRSSHFRGLDITTQDKRRGILESTYCEPVYPGAAETFADMPVHRMTSKAVRVLRDRKGPKLPAAANLRIKTVGYVFAWAIEEEVRGVTTNPARDVPRIKTASSGYHTWTQDEIEKFEKRHPVGTKARLAFAIFRYAGVRKSDAVRLGRQHARNGWFRFRVYKNRNRHPVDIEIPIRRELQQIIDASPTGDLTYLVTDFGKPFSIKGAGNWFRDRCDEAGLPHCSAHGLRKAAATALAEAGVTAHQLMALMGWKSLQEAERYTRAAERKKLAGDGMQMLDENEARTKVSHRNR